MSNLKNIWNQAIKLFHPNNVSAMAHCCGSTDGSWESVPDNRRSELAGVLSRMMKDGIAITKAKEDFAIMAQVNAGLMGKAPHTDDDDDDDDDDDAETNASARRKQPKRQMLEERAIWDRWNNPPNGRRLGEGL